MKNRRIRERRDVNLCDPHDYSVDEERQAEQAYDDEVRRKERARLCEKISTIVGAKLTQEARDYLGWLRFCLCALDY